MIIIGAGAIGLCTAAELARRGVRVTVLDQAGPAAGASFGNAGLISLAHPPLPRPGLVAQLLRSLADRGAPAQIRATLSPRYWRFLAGMARAGTRKAFERNMTVVAELSRLTPALFERYRDDEALSFEYRGTGYMDVFHDARLFEHARTDAALIESLGFEEHILSESEARDHEPALKPGIAGAVRHVGSAVADPAAFTHALAAALRSRGVQIEEDTPVEDFLTHGGRITGVRDAKGNEREADAVVLAAGAWSGRLAAKAGVRIPMLSGRGYHVTVRHEGEPVRTSVHLGGHWLACTSMGDTLRIAGLLDLVGLSHEMPDHRMAKLIPTASEFLEGLTHATPITRWAGLRPCTPDGLPAIGEHPARPGLFINTGHAMMGFWTAPACGLLAAQSIVGEPPSTPMTPFLPSRFGHARG